MVSILKDQIDLVKKQLSQHKVTPNYNEDIELSENIKIILVGDGYVDQDAFNEMISRMELRDRVISVGHVSDRDLVDLYQAADIYMDPSLYEGFGLQVLEAMSCGVPVLCSNTTSLAEIASDVGLTCEPTNIEDFAHGIEYLVSNTAQAISEERPVQNGFLKGAYLVWSLLKTQEQVNQMNDDWGF